MVVAQRLHNELITSTTSQHVLEHVALDQLHQSAGACAWQYGTLQAGTGRGRTGKGRVMVRYERETAGLGLGQVRTLHIVTHSSLAQAMQPLAVGIKLMLARAHCMGAVAVPGVCQHACGRTCQLHAQLVPRPAVHHSPPSPHPSQGP